MYYSHSVQTLPNLGCIHTRKVHELTCFGPNTMLSFGLFGAVRFQNKTTRTLKVIHSLVHPFNRTRACLESDRDHLFSWVSVRLFGAHPSVIAVFTPAQKIHTKGTPNEHEFDSIEPNETGVNTPLHSDNSNMMQWSLHSFYLMQSKW